MITLLLRHDGKQMLTVPCVTTCHDLAEVADHTWKMTCHWFPNASLCRRVPDQWRKLVCWTLKAKTEDKHIYVLQKQKSNMQIVENLLYWLWKIICILNGVCCAIVHLHCINVKNNCCWKLNVWTKSAKMWRACGVNFFCLSCDSLSSHIVADLEAAIFRKVSGWLSFLSSRRWYDCMHVKHDSVDLM